jgi:hypothetical protein
MRPQILRLVLTLATFVVAWLVVPGIASAAVQAPVCDPRGAIMFAPPPQLQDPDSSLDVVVNDDDCTRSPLEQRNVMPEQAPQRIASSSFRDAAAVTASVPVPTAAPQRLPAPDASHTSPRPGFRTSLERPPRA